MAGKKTVKAVGNTRSIVQNAVNVPCSIRVENDWFGTEPIYFYVDVINSSTLLLTEVDYETSVRMGVSCRLQGITNVIETNFPEDFRTVTFISKNLSQGQVYLYISNEDNTLDIEGWSEMTGLNRPVKKYTPSEKKDVEPAIEAPAPSPVEVVYETIHCIVDMKTEDVLVKRGKNGLEFYSTVSSSANKAEPIDTVAVFGYHSIVLLSGDIAEVKMSDTLIKKRKMIIYAQCGIEPTAYEKPFNMFVSHEHFEKPIRRFIDTAMTMKYRITDIDRFVKAIPSLIDAVNDSVYLKNGIEYLPGKIGGVLYDRFGIKASKILVEKYVEYFRSKL